MPQSVLRLVNAAAAHAVPATPTQVAARRRARRVPSRATQFAQQRFTLLVQTYSYELNDAQRRGFKTLAASMGYAAARDCFVAVNTCRLQANMGMLLDPPEVGWALPQFPAFTLTATSSAGVFSLNVTLTSEYAGCLLITATRPLSPGIMEIHRSAFQLIRSEIFVPGGGYDVGQYYVDTFGRGVPANMRVGVTITPLSETGFPGPAISQNVLVTAS